MATAGYIAITLVGQSKNVYSSMTDHQLNNPLNPSSIFTFHAASIQGRREGGRGHSTWYSVQRMEGGTVSGKVALKYSSLMSAR